MIKFLTGNKNKFREAKIVLGDLIEQAKMELPEIQGLDAKIIAGAKLKEAEKHIAGEYIVEDSSLYLDCLGSRLPGPLIKWFEVALGWNQGLYDLVQKMGSDGAEARVIFGYSDPLGEITFFEASRRGRIVSPRGENGFGWDPIFLPEGHDLTFGEMSPEDKQKYGMRGEALRELKKYLEQNKNQNQS